MNSNHDKPAESCSWLIINNQNISEAKKHSVEERRIMGMQIIEKQRTREQGEQEREKREMRRKERWPHP